jgi:hypothetical protein
MIQLTQEEIQTLTKFKEDKTKISYELGVLESEIIFFQNQKEKVKEKFLKLTEEEEQIGKELFAKYGDGTIDLEQGIFSPIK